MKAILIHFGEIALKGKNRGEFETLLVRNIKSSLGKLVDELDRQHDRIIAYPSKSDAKTRKLLAEKLEKIPGISWFTFCEICKTDIGKIKQTAAKIAKGKIEKKKFKVETRRAYKEFEHDSMDINRIVGKELEKKFRSTAEYKNPELTVFIEVTKDKTFVFSDKIRGAGGLPLGSSGKVLVLLSGGIDSAVAAWLMMKRGCSVDYLHVHALPDSESVRKSKISKIMKILRELDSASRLFVVPYHEFDVRAQKIPPQYNMIVFRRFIFELAEKFARKIGASAVVAGDNLGQVASQTLEGLSAVDDAVRIPVFRPLLTYDKEEIIQLAKRIGTYEPTIELYKDCCSIVSRHPIIRPKLDEVQKYEKEIDLNEVIDKTMGEIVELR